jgi:hypothetical protein
MFCNFKPSKLFMFPLRIISITMLIIVLSAFFYLVKDNFAEAVNNSTQPKKVVIYDENVVVGPKSQLTASIALKNNFKSAFDSFVKSLDEMPEENNVPINVEVFSGRIKKSSDEDVDFLNRKKEGYRIKITRKGVNILGVDEAGAMHGLTTLEHLAISGRGKVSEGEILDWPDHKKRLIQIVIRKISVKDAKRFISTARMMHFNGTILELRGGWVQLLSIRKIPLSEKAWTIEELKEFVRFARENGLEVIPAIPLLTHQEMLLGNSYPEIMFNRWTYDPRKEGTYKVIFPIIDEVIKIFQPKAIHIGHDEVAGLNPKTKSQWMQLRKGERALPPELFLRDVEILHAYLKKKGIETWMWGDMLLAPEEFPGMLQRHLHGIKGYAALRDKLPKDIVICDWHYFGNEIDFPSALAFSDAGYRVLGATWKSKTTTRNFSRYVAKMSRGGEGMIACLWDLIVKDYDLARKVIKTSAEAFWNSRSKLQN